MTLLCLILMLGQLVGRAMAAESARLDDLYWHACLLT